MSRSGPAQLPFRSASHQPNPIVLAIDTAGSACSAAVTRGGAVLAAERRPMRHGHGEALLPMIDRVVAATGLAPERIDIVAAATGPGGFTGIRVGLAAAHGIALATGARLIGISSFEAVAAAVGDSRALLVVGTVAILAYTAWFTGQHFADSIGWPLALMWCRWPAGSRRW